LSDARNSLKTSDFTAAVKDLDEAIKSAGDDPLGQQAAILRVALVTALADTGKQMADAYGLGAKEPAARSRSGAFSKMRADYYGIARSRLMDAMQSVMNQRSKLSGNPMPVQINFPGFTGGTDPTVTKIKGGQWVADGDRKSTRLNSSHDQISYAVFCLKKKKHPDPRTCSRNRPRHP